MTPTEPNAQTPTVGRIVHYVAYGTPVGEFPKTCRAAVVIEVTDAKTVGLVVLNPQGLFFHQNLPYDDSADPK